MTFIVTSEDVRRLEQELKEAKAELENANCLLDKQQQKWESDLAAARKEMERASESSFRGMRKEMVDRFEKIEQLGLEAKQWENLYRKAIDVANGLTNYVEDRPELRRMEKELAAIQQEARDIVARGGKK